MAQSKRGRRAYGDPPTYCKHRASGLAYVFVNGRRKYLGPYGSMESKRRFREIIRQWEAEWSEVERASVRPLHAHSLADLIAAFLSHAQHHYRRRDGSQTDEARAFALSLRPLLEGFPGYDASDFTPRDLKSVRDDWIAAGLARKTINKQVGRIRRMFRWGVEEEIIPESTAVALAMVRDLAAGRSAAQDRPGVAPVPLRSIVAVRRVLDGLRTVGMPAGGSQWNAAVLRDMIAVQYYVGARPGEVCSMHAAEVNTAGVATIDNREIRLPAGVWTFQPAQHKAAHTGKPIVYAIGPRAREILAPRFENSAANHGYLFGPIVAHGRGMGQSPHYRVDSYAHAVARAAGLAGVEAWSPNQLRHNFLTARDRASGIQLASYSVGHTSVNTTAVYVERNLAAVAHAAAQFG